MRVSYNWLKELVNLDVSCDKLVEEMSLYSIEIEEYSKLLPASGLVIGEVVDLCKHENSDHLSVCQVNLGSNVSQIVCGAPNVRKGQKVIVALPGVKLPGGEIKVSVIRGAQSNGMLCSLQELGLESKYIPEEFSKGIYVLDDDAIVGEDALTYLNLEDHVIELGVTPNRMDLLSMLGVAKDVNAMYGLGLKPLEYELHEIDKEASSQIDVELQTSICYSYYARVVEDVKIKESPSFIKARLIASGIRPINNVVDITNYVLQLFGQPLHAFDKDELGNKIIVRRANQNEETVTLDGNKRILNRSDIVITDNKLGDNEPSRIVCLAGVMGGENTEVTDKTTNLVLESAVFRPLSIRRTSSRLGLRSESSIRFERGVDLNQSLEAVNYACYLLEKYADGKVLKGYVHKGTEHVTDKVITLTKKYVYDYLGVEISIEEMDKIFKGLSFTTEIHGDEITVYVPNRRLDITIKQDLIEELARIYGYDKLEETIPSMNNCAEYTKEQKIRRLISSTLRGAGLNETVTYSLVSETKANEFKVLYTDTDAPISLLHPMSEERKVLRRNLVSSLIDVVKYNNARKLENLAIYEIGKHYSYEDEKTTEGWSVAGALQGVQSTNLWSSTSNKVDFYYVKGILELLFNRLNLNVSYKPLSIKCDELHPGRSAEIIYNNKIIGYVGALHPKYAKMQDLENTYVFEICLDEIFEVQNEITMMKPISKVPAVVRDLAFIMDNNQPIGDIVEAIYRVDKKMIKMVEVFDVYSGDRIEEGKKSVALKVMLESDDTLTDEVINQKVNKIIKSLEYQFHITLRG